MTDIKSILLTITIVTAVVLLIATIISVQDDMIKEEVEESKNKKLNIKK